MADKLTTASRSSNMRAIKSKDTAPELAVRRLAHSMGYRFRLHPKELPGKPDLTFPKRKKVIFVHGCFWHQHPRARCLDGRRPKSNTAYWDAKLTHNAARDERNQARLEELGWKVLVLWECETTGAEGLRHKLRDFLENASGTA